MQYLSLVNQTGRTILSRGIGTMSKAIWITMVHWPDTMHSYINISHIVTMSGVLHINLILQNKVVIFSCNQAALWMVQSVRLLYLYPFHYVLIIISSWSHYQLQKWRSIEEVPNCFSRAFIKFQGHTDWKFDDLDPIWLSYQSQLSNPSDDLPCFITFKLLQ